MSTEGQEVTYAKLHTPLFIPGLGDYKQTLDASVIGPDMKLKMYLLESYLLLVTKGKKVAIPLANVTHMLLKD